jgi:hypothetical protein
MLSPSISTCVETGSLNSILQRIFGARPFSDHIASYHIVLAQGRAYTDISPVVGIILGSSQQDVVPKV